MSNYATPIETYMSAPAITVRPAESLQTAQERMLAHRVSSLAVVDNQNKPVGVVSRTDLIRAGRRQAGNAPKAALLVLPDHEVSTVMTKTVATATRDESVREAARRMIDRRVHRLYVVDGDALVGVISTKDVMTALAESRHKAPLSEYMSSPLFTIRASEPVALATERLERAHVHGLVVVDDDWPIGLFTQVESLASRDLPRDTPTEDVMTPAMLCLQQDSPMHRAAAQAGATSVRRVIALDGRRMVGILTGLDFMRAVS